MNTLRTLRAWWLCRRDCGAERNEHGQLVAVYSCDRERCPHRWW